MAAALDLLREESGLPDDSAEPLILESVGAASPVPTDPAALACLVTAAESAATHVASTYSSLPTGVASVDFVTENPLNALWVFLLTTCLALDGWDMRTTSYCN